MGLGLGNSLAEAGGQIFGESFGKNHSLDPP